ncbi:Uncharacterised protein [Vibrio cholerae]|nr:Uncharacterised protein [Vibrio cholerae]
MRRIVECQANIAPNRYFLTLIYKLSIWLRYASAVLRIAC